MVFNLLHRSGYVIDNHELNDIPFSEKISDGNAYKLKKVQPIRRCPERLYVEARSCSSGRFQEPSQVIAHDRFDGWLRQAP